MGRSCYKNRLPVVHCVHLRARHCGGQEPTGRSAKSYRFVTHSTALVVIASEAKQSQGGKDIQV